MATGGIINAQHALSYAKYGRCSVFQIASAVQEQDFGIIEDLNSGLRAALGGVLPEVQRTTLAPLPRRLVAAVLLRLAFLLLRR